MGPTGSSAILQVHPTRRCNLRCLHCYSSSGPFVNAALEPDVIIGVLADAADLGYDVVGVSGGEPLLYKPLVDLLTAAKSLGFRTTVTSNGLLLTERRLAQLAGLVDVLAISLDGTPESHVRMRGDARAFTQLDRRMPAVRASGIPFGFITTLTMHNVHELAFVAQYAAKHGARMVQIHPLEPEGAAVINLPQATPDGREMGFAYLEAARLSAVYHLPFQVDLVQRAELVDHPDRFLTKSPPSDAPLGTWLTPLVLETDGTVVPMSYGFSRQFALGRVLSAPLRQLAAAWNPEPLRALCACVHQKLVTEGWPFVSWYDELARAANSTVAVVQHRAS